MISSIEKGFRKIELSILIHMQMLIKAISLADIVKLNKFKMSKREQFEWPNAAPTCTKKQAECWQKVLQVTFGVLHPIPSE